MRYMVGGSLAGRLGEGPLTIVEASRIFDWLAPGLAPIHYQEDNISDECCAAVIEARAGLAYGSIDTGYIP